MREKILAHFRELRGVRRIEQPEPEVVADPEPSRLLVEDPGLTALERRVLDEVFAAGQRAYQTKNGRCPYSRPDFRWAWVLGWRLEHFLFQQRRQQ